MSKYNIKKGLKSSLKKLLYALGIPAGILKIDEAIRIIPDDMKLYAFVIISALAVGIENYIKHK